MTIKHLAAALAATTIAAAAPAIASAETTAPVAISSVQNTPALGYLNTYNPGLLTVAFQNTSDIPATDVVFELESNGKYLDRYDDAGSFAKGVSVKHSFNNWETALDQHVAVAEVKFADGSVWYNDAVQSTRALRQAAATDSVSAYTNEDF
jgi:hypothetical protein